MGKLQIIIYLDFPLPSSIESPNLTFCAESRVNDQAMGPYFCGMYFPPSSRIFLFKMFDDSSTGLSGFWCLARNEGMNPDAHEKLKHKPAFWDVVVGRIGRNPNWRMNLHGSIGAPPLPTLYSPGPVFVTQSRQHSINITKKSVHFSSGCPKCGLYNYHSLSDSDALSTPMKYIEMLGWSGCHCMGHHGSHEGHTHHPGSQTTQVVATASVAFLALVANTQVMLGFYQGGG